MQFTEEQKNVISTDLKARELLIVDSGAGSGKTTCSIGYSAANPTKKILYICFNNKGAAEAREKYRKKGIKNTVCSTLHGLAREIKGIYTKIGKFQTRINLKDIQNKLLCTQEAAWKIKSTLKNFCESADKEIDEEHLVFEVKQEEKQQILSQTRSIWGAIIDLENDFPISYDQYLKVYQLTNPKLHFDTIILDEAQDSNPLSLSIVNQQRERSGVIMVGDENQAIYSWRGAHNAMASNTPTYRKSLTESFRFGPEVAKVANIILNTYQKRGGTIKGHKSKDSIGSLPTNLPYTLIARTNGNLFSTAIEHTRLNKKFHFVGTQEENNWDPSVPYKFNDARDVYKLWIGDKKGITSPHLRLFENYDELKKIAVGTQTQTGTESHGDKELESLCKIVEKYGHQLPNILQEIISNCTSPQNSDILLVTAHRAKGLEWPRVKLANDFCPLIISKQEDDPNETPALRLAKPITKENPKGDVDIEEFNLLYVAVTRAEERLELNEKLQELLSSKFLLPHIKETEFPKENNGWEYKASQKIANLKNEPINYIQLNTP